MKWLLIFGSLLSFQAMAQENLSAGLKFGMAKSGPIGMAEVYYDKEVVNLGAGAGSNGDSKSIGFVDVEFKDYNYIGKSKKFKILMGYSPLTFNSSSIAITTEAFLKLKLGVAYDKSKIKYSFSPLASLQDRQGEIQRTIFHGVELEQSIGDHVKIAALAKYGMVKGSKALNIKGEYLGARSEASYKFKNGIQILAFYDMEDYSITKLASVDNQSRAINSKNSLKVIGAGVRINVNAVTGQ